MPARSLGSGFAEAYSAERPIRIAVFTGRHQVLAQVEGVGRLAEDAGQYGAALGLAYVLEEEFAARKIPHLVCFFLGGAPSSAGKNERLVGAALLFEYRIRQFRTGLVATGDSFGVRTVYGAGALREEIAVATCKALLDRGARMVLVSLKGDLDKSAAMLPPGGGGGYRWALAAREVQDSMLLGKSLEETLGSLGKRTRTRLRASRKRFDEAIACVFVADAVGRLPLEEEEFLARLNEGSLDPIGQATFNLQLRSTERLPGGFVCGLRSEEFGWVGLLGGWRQKDTTWVEWQVNKKGFERFSIGSVLRSYLLEEEVGRGTQRLGFHGSTSHSMAHRFLRERVVDVVARRRSFVASLLVRLVPWVFRRARRLAQRGNFLADALNLPGLKWTRRLP